MELLCGACSLLVNGLVFQPLPQARYDFDFKHPERRLVFIPISINEASPPQSSPSAHENDARRYLVPCLLIPGKNTSSNRRIITHFHGTSGDVVKSAVYATLSSQLPDFDVLLVEFPGYGLASPMCFDGTAPFFATKDSVLHVARSVVRFLLDQAKINIADIVFSGRSMGSGIATQLAAEFPSAAGLCLISPYADMTEVVAAVAAEKLKKRVSKPTTKRIVTSLVNLFCFFGGTAMFAPQNSIAAAAAAAPAAAASATTKKVFIAHGARDGVISVEHAHRLKSKCDAANAADVTLHVDPKGEHSELVYTEQLVAFLNGKLRDGASTNVDWSIVSASFASAEAIAKLRRALPADKVAAKAFKTRTRAVLMAAVGVTVMTTLLATWLVGKFLVSKVSSILF